MEKVNHKSFVFRFLFFSFLIIFALSCYFYPRNIPSLSDFFYAVFSPFQDVVSPIQDLLDSFNAIIDFINGGGLPTLENLLNLFLSPLQFVLNVLVVFVRIIERLVDLFMGVNA